MPLVSVIIPAFNAEATIERALRSILEQTYKDYEVIVVDDASRDGTLSRIERIAAGRDGIRVIALQTNRGAAAARNVGIGAAAGELVAFLDADDEWLPDKLARQVEALDAAPQAVVAGCNAVWLTPSGKFSHKLEARPVTTGADAWKALLRSCYLSTPCVVARRAALEAEGGFDESLPVGEDQDLWFRLAARGEVLFLPEVLVRIHKQRDSLMSRQIRGMATHYMPMIERHVARNRHRLTKAERRVILGPKYSKAGRYLYLAGDPALGLRMMMRAIAIGFRPVYHILFIIGKAPPLRAVTRRIRRLMSQPEKASPHV